ncbi:aminoglycoside phosphotransferase family protein [Streptomyces sp. cg36]|uniref:aminoglycoside phosphotransferase family protein n=1 Tax=Streptomyces sp. cg36 TaxID=3238798 RepID=UPI0034E2D42B
MTCLSPEAQRSAESRGEHGRAWIAALPALVADLCAQWSLTPGRSIDGGKWAYVAHVTTAAGDDAVLKVLPPEAEFDLSTSLIAAADGDGYVRLLAQDTARRALLLEALGPPLGAADLPPERMLDILAATLRQAWRAPCVPGVTVSEENDKARGLIGLLDTLWPATGKPCSARLISLARGLAEQRAADSATALVACHGDAHPGNILRARTPRPGAESGYVLVDPDGILCDPAYDLAVAMSGWQELILRAEDPAALVRGWSARLARATGLDERTIWEWALVERVTSGLYLLHHGHDTEARELLASAELLV